MPKLIKKIFILFSLLVIIFGYNNCAQPIGEDINESRKFESEGNGTPYGGKLSPGDYIPSANQVCDASYSETIRVEDVNGDERVSLETPCTNSSQTIDINQLSVANDKLRIMYNNIGFAHESTARAQAKDYYMVACRTTEANYGAEVLVYGPAPVYTFEHISLNSGFTLYSALVNFQYQGLTPSRHRFVGANDQLALQETETKAERFVGIWDSTSQSTEDFQRMICDIINGDPVSGW